MRFGLGRLIDVARIRRTNGVVAIGNEGYCAGNGLIVPDGRAFQCQQGGAEEAHQEGDGDGAGAGLLTALALGEAVEGFAGVRDE